MYPAPAGESLWPPVIAVSVFTVLNIGFRAWLPSDRAVAVPWLLPAIEVILIVVLIVADPTGGDRRSVRFRRMVVVLVGLLLAVALWATVVLIDHLVTGAPQVNSGGRLLASGVLVWLGNIVAFSLVYWVFDSGGPGFGASGDVPIAILRFRKRKTRTSRLTAGSQPSWTTSTWRSARVPPSVPQM